MAVDGDTISLNDGGATVQVPDVETANAVFLIDSVMIPPASADRLSLSTGPGSSRSGPGRVPA